MMVLLLLIGTFLIALVVIKLVKGKWNLTLSGCIGMSGMLLFTALGHFLFPKGMEMMIPPFFPFRLGLVYFTGLLEIAAAIGLLIPKYRRITSILLIIFFVMILPANIYAALHHINLETATTDGKGPEYLWTRIPEQIIFIAWVWFFGIRNKAKALSWQP
ncbi:hypothetical protein GFS24_01690 [Chitinophaga sp. SYP-B3965]|uniref:DoxX family protein n=1 Tax=Chitinophaga sp. SYP-B3965 TaxID=2663120 RepID=UPI0012998958|nr:hypothetical protein [Chitinophaga sp. SYP-B3965]MRG43803.1 hypothetical protein [Chitinophaga sp. SYP-B3965]